MITSSLQLLTRAERVFNALSYHIAFFGIYFEIYDGAMAG
jgi:hypothetical protein